MESNHFQLIAQQKAFKQQLSFKMEANNAWDTEELFDETVTITIAKYADVQEPEYVFSITFPSPMIVYTVKDGEGKERKICKLPTTSLVDKVFKEFGTPHYRSEHSIRDTHYMSDNQVGKNRFTAFYKEKPTQELPLFYTLCNSDGSYLSSWTMVTKCLQTEIINVCDFCRDDISMLREGNRPTHAATANNI